MKHLPGTAPRVLRRYLAGLLVLWAMSALPLLVRSRKLWSTASLWFDPPFFDFGCYYDRIQLIHKPEFWTELGPTWNYPAPSIFVYQLFYMFNRGHAGGAHRVFFGFLTYLAFVGLVMLATWSMLVRRLIAKKLSPSFVYTFWGLTFLFCWPIFFGMERGNIEFFLDAGVALGLWCYVQRRWWLAAIFIGLFGAGKLYPLLFLALLLPARRWKEFLVGVATATGITMFAVHWIGSAPIGSAHLGILRGIQNWITEYSLTLQPQSVGLDHSMFGLLKRVDSKHPETFALLAVSYAVITAMLMVLLFFTRVWRLPRFNQTLFVSVAVVLLPPTSFDYTLMLLIPVWIWLVLLICDNGARAGLALVCFAVLFAPETFAVFHGMHVAGQLKTMFLVLLLWLALTGKFDGRPRLDSKSPDTGMQVA